MDLPSVLIPHSFHHHHHPSMQAASLVDGHHTHSHTAVDEGGKEEMIPLGCCVEPWYTMRGRKEMQPGGMKGEGWSSSAGTHFPHSTRLFSFLLQWCSTMRQTMRSLPGHWLWSTEAKQTYFVISAEDDPPAAVAESHSILSRYHLRASVDKRFGGSMTVMWRMCTGTEEALHSSPGSPRGHAVAVHGKGIQRKSNS